jgi:hypothetical protein
MEGKGMLEVSDWRVVNNFDKNIGGEKRKLPTYSYEHQRVFELSR